MRLPVKETRISGDEVPTIAVKIVKKTVFYALISLSWRIYYILSIVLIEM